MARIYHQKITIIRTKRPADPVINDELQWLGDSLGLFNLRDRDKSCFRIFIELLKASKIRQPLTSDQLAAGLQLTRGTVIHHINKLMDSGIVIHEQRGYTLRVDNLKDLVQEIKKDIERTCDDLLSVASDIDRRLGL